MVLAKVSDKLNMKRGETVASATDLPKQNTTDTSVNHSNVTTLQTTENANYDGYAYGFSKTFR